VGDSRGEASGYEVSRLLPLEGYVFTSPECIFGVIIWEPLIITPDKIY
jgi:hypothetical protein